MTSNSTLTAQDYFALSGTLAKTAVGSVAYATATGAWRPHPEKLTYGQWIETSMIRTFTGGLSIRQQQALQASTADAYAAFMKKAGLPVDVVDLEEGGKGCWIGDRSARIVTLWFHGGAYTAAASSMHFQWMLKLIAKAKEGGGDTAVLLLQYGLAPQGVWPRQLGQAVQALQYLLKIVKKAPLDVVIGGDSAGGGLAASPMAHLCHPHPSIPAIHLQQPLKSAILVSPWVTFAQDSKSMTENEQLDFLTKPLLKKCSDALMGNTPVDVYNTPKSAGAEFWRVLRERIQSVKVVAGELELFVDDVKDFVKAIETAKDNSAELFVEDRGQHTAPLGDVFKGREGPASIKVKEWIIELTKTS